MNKTIAAFVAPNSNQNCFLNQAIAVRQFLNTSGIVTGDVVALQANASQSSDVYVSIAQLQAWGIDPQKDGIQFQILNGGSSLTDENPQSQNVALIIARLSQPGVALSTEVNEVNKNFNPTAADYTFLLNSAAVAAAVNATLAGMKGF